MKTRFPNRRVAMAALARSIGVEVSRELFERMVEDCAQALEPFH